MSLRARDSQVDTEGVKRVSLSGRDWLEGMFEGCWSNSRVEMGTSTTQETFDSRVSELTSSALYLRYRDCGALFLNLSY